MALIMEWFGDACTPGWLLQAWVSVPWWAGPQTVRSILMAAVQRAEEKVAMQQQARGEEAAA